MESPAQPKARSRLRTILRRCRIGLLLLVLTAAVALVYANRIGLPDSIKQSLMLQLQARGLDVEFSRLRFHWHRGIVGEDIRVGRPGQPFGPQAFVDEAAVRLDPRELLRLRLTVTGLDIRGGRLIWPLPQPDQHRLVLQAGNIATDLRFLPGERVEVDDFSATVHGANLRLSGTITNLARLRQQTLTTAAPAPPRPLESRLLDVAQSLTNYHFSLPPSLRLRFSGDATNPASFRADLAVSLPALTAPWGSARGCELHARLQPPAGDRPLSLADVNLRFAEAQTPWGSLEELQFTTQLSSSFDLRWPTNSGVTLEIRSAKTRWGRAQQVALKSRSNPSATNALWLQTQLELSARDLDTPWGTAQAAALTSQFLHAHTNVIPLQGRGDLQAARVVTPRCSADKIQVQLTRHPSVTNGPAEATPRGAWWSAWESYPLDINADLEAGTLGGVAFRRASVGGQWRAPEIRAGQARVESVHGPITIAGDLNLFSRELRARAVSDLDLKPLLPLLVTNAPSWFRDCGWEQAPHLAVEARLKLPPWTGRLPGWQEDLLASAEVRGELRVDGALFRGVRIGSVNAAGACTSNRVDVTEWRLTRPEGTLEASLAGNLATREGEARLSSGIDWLVFRPWFGPKVQRVFDLFQFTLPPQIDGSVRGRWGDWTNLQAAVSVSATNMAFRSEPIGYVRTRAGLTNLVIHIAHPEARQGNKAGSATAIDIDLGRNRIFFRDVQGNLDPYSVTRAIGPKTAAAIVPFRFEEPPQITLNGSIPLDKQSRGAESSEDEDMRFQVAGGPFQWWKFRLPQVQASLHWLGDTLSVANARAAFYQGQLIGNAAFDLHTRTNTRFQFATTFRDVQLQPLLRDVTTPTNPLSGTLDGELSITSGDTANPYRSWQGYGRAELRDGMVWDAPVLGIFSSILNGIIPGLGNNRATDVAGSFVITNSVIHSDRMDIRSTGVRLTYRGTVDFQLAVNARVEGELLKDAPLLGPLISLVLLPVTKILEYKVTGTLGQPVAEPLYVPKLLLMPLQPFKTLRDLFTPGPPKPKPPPPTPSTPPPDSPPQ